MVTFKASILQFAEQGEKTGWQYISVPAKLAEQLLPGNKKAFRVKGKLDSYAISAVSLLPMGGGDFILAFNAGMRKGTGKQKGASLQVKLELDQQPLQLNKELMDCLADEPPALAFFKTISGGYQRYFSNWVDSAKTTATRTKRIATAVNALSQKMNFQEMIRATKKARKDLLG